jgi:hypothetical protein
MGAAAREEIEPHPEDVTEVLCAVSARLDTLVRRRAAHDAAARGPPPRPESSEYLAQAAPARQIPGTVSLHGVPWAAKGALQRFDPRAGAHTQASSAPSLSAPFFRRASSCDAASRASTELGSRSAEGALASRRRVEAPPTLCLRTGAESASDPASRALRSRGCPQDGAPVSGERSASQALSSASAAAALVSAVLSLLAVLLSAASSILAPLCSSRPPWWPRSCESPQRPARQGEGRAAVSPWSNSAAGLDLLFIDWMDVDSY